MKTYSNKNYIKENIKRIIDNPEVIVDATCGNGNDTLFLATQYPNSKIYAFDIQEIAIKNTKKRCIENNNITYILDSHDKIEKYVNKEIDMVIFNLGYLPYNDKNIVTQYESTKKALNKSLKKLKKGGVIFLTVYNGDENIDETLQIKKFIKNIDKDFYIVSKYELFNLSNAPENIIIEKK